MATPSGGAIGIVRVSGPETISIADSLFSGNLSEAKAATLHYGQFYNDQGSLLDDVVIGLWRAPHSYTGEDCVEISCHGSAYILGQVLQALINKGCRHAGPGEYTMRAYLNGKMDLSQAEAVADLVASNNRASQQAAISQIKGHFSSVLSILREQLLKMTSLLELELDFSDHEELEFADRGELKQLAKTIDKKLTELIDSYATGQALREGVAVAIVGATNVGKSTLLNQLLQDDKAIVSPVAGTTRDVIDGTTVIHGVTFRFVDTAGIRKTNDQIEQLGIERTFSQLQKAKVVLYVTDNGKLAPDFKEVEENVKDKPLIIIENKTDLRPASLKNEAHPVIAISAKKGYGIAELREKIFESAGIREVNETSVIVTNARHYGALLSAKKSIDNVLQALSAQISADLIAEDLHQCSDELANITGVDRITPTETLSSIFSHFCIGK
ncbi:MAG: tRNA uridine-5-carboxymethylaminomethyl(34) synthesis GTPase MnmE [Prevotella sp.]|nr:tRNA uridine-5-carboxymethylaminomethyl(34) synthesis GTPase MnmE [Prevotella sp.]